MYVSAIWPNFIAQRYALLELEQFSIYLCPNPPGRAPTLTVLVGDWANFLSADESGILMFCLVLYREVF